MSVRALDRSLVAALALGALATGCIVTPSGRTQLALYPEATLEAQATALYDDMLANQPISQDETARNLVLCVSNAITSTLPAGSPQYWQVTVFEDDTANAFALPGGKIGVHTGLLRVADNPDQLAAVIGHEIAHVLERHANARASNQAALEIAVSAGTEAVGAASDMSTAEVDALGQVFGLGAQYGAILPYSRSHESIADEFGLQLMATAGFDPRESVDLWRNMAAASQGQPLEWMSTHPSHGTRIEQLSAEMPRAMELYRRAQEAGRRPHCS